MDFLDYLRSERIYVDEPEEQEGIRTLKKIENEPRNITFQNFYRVSHKKPKVFCHICGAHRHWNGITGVFENKEKILFGSSCAKSYFGEEITRLCGAELRERTKNAQAKFNIEKIKSSLRDINEWLNSYRELVYTSEKIWLQLKSKYEEPVEEILTHLKKNNGRYIETEVEVRLNPKGKKEYFQHEKILGSVSDVQSIPYLVQLSQRLQLVEVFTAKVTDLNPTAEQQIMRNLDRMFRSMKDAATEIDYAIGFTHSFFTERNLEIMNSILEDTRYRRLGKPKNFKPRNLKKVFTKIAGTGFPKPSKSLLEAINTTEIEATLNSEQDSIKDIV